MTIGRDGYEGYGEHKKKYQWLNRRIYNILQVESRASELLPEITMAIIAAESNGKRLAISPTGCIGYMQINPKYWHKHNPRELFQARMNVHYGVNIFAMYYKQTGNIVMALKKYERGNLPGINQWYISKIIGDLIDK